MEQFYVKATLKWANVNEVSGKNSMSDKYQVDLYDLSDADVKKIESLGVPAKKHKETGETFFTAKSTRPVLVVDATKAPVHDKKLGNGTKANVAVIPYDWEFKGKNGVNLGLQGIQILELVEFGGNALDVFPDAVEDSSQEIPF